MIEENSSKVLKSCTTFEVTVVSGDEVTSEKKDIVSEVPYTIVVNDCEIATLLCTPSLLKELTYGFLYTNGMIQNEGDILSFTCDKARWTGYVQLDGMPDQDLLNKRVYTSGCGRGVVYSSVVEITARSPLKSDFKIKKDYVKKAIKWLLQSSELYNRTHGVHTVAMGIDCKIPDMSVDDIGRHNAVDKVIGNGLLNKTNFTTCIILSTGRVSSEILHKVKRAGIPIIVARGVPTHQAILRAREMNLTLIGSARSSGFVIYSQPGRII